MKKHLVLGFLFLLPLLGFAENRVEAAAQKLASNWTKDGVELKSGFDTDGTQNLVVLAKGGYFPLKMSAKAGVKSVLRVYTNKTADCSRVFQLPEYKVQVVLPPSGYKEFAIPAQKKGQVLFGVCGMGMYTFEIAFTE
ncbi:MAG: hypothetical protein WCG80_16535 [Spirochaetales bacterium]